MSTGTSLTVEAERHEDGVRYVVRNVGETEVWAYLLVPAVQGGELVLEDGGAWSTLEGSTLVLRKVQAVPPPEVDAEALDSGAVPLAPGEARTGTIALRSPARLREPFARGPAREVTFDSVVVEVGWVVPERPPKRLTDAGRTFAYVDPRSVAGGQHVARSEPVPWTR